MVLAVSDCGGASVGEGWVWAKGCLGLVVVVVGVEDEASVEVGGVVEGNWESLDEARRRIVMMDFLAADLDVAFGVDMMGDGVVCSKGASVGSGDDIGPSQ